MRPTGTVTLLFSDIDGSTRLLRSIGVQRYESALAQHRSLLRDAFARHAGYEVDTAGDSFFIAFERALDVTISPKQTYNRYASSRRASSLRNRLRRTAKT